MKQLLKLTGCLALAGLFASCQSAQQDANYQIIPMPQEIVTAQGSPFILKSSVKILYPEGNEKMQRNAKFLAWQYPHRQPQAMICAGTGCHRIRRLP